MRFEEHGDVRVAGGRVRAGEREWRADVRPAGERVRVTLDGIARRYAFARDGDTLWIARDGHHLELRAARAARGAAAHGADSLEAPMPGTVLLVNASNGDAVEEGQVLLVIESMKMELSIAAPHGGTVAGARRRRSATRSACARCWRRWSTLSGCRSATATSTLIEDLETRLARVRAGGGERARERHTSRGKLLAARPRRAALRPRRPVPRALAAGR